MLLVLKHFLNKFDETSAKQTTARTRGHSQRPLPQNTVVRVVIKRNLKALRETGSSTALHSLKLIVFTVSQVCLLLNVHLKTNMSYDEIMLFSPMIEKIKQTPFLPPPCTLNALDI